MDTIEQSFRIKYIGQDGLAYWHGKLSTLKQACPGAKVLNKEIITSKLYENG